MLSFQQASSTLLEEIENKKLNQIVNKLITQETLLESSPFMNIMLNPTTLNHYYEILRQYENMSDELDNLVEEIVKNITQQLFQRYCLNSKLLNNYSQHLIKSHISAMVLSNFFGYIVEHGIGRKEETQLKKLDILKQDLHQVEKSNLYQIVNKKLQPYTRKLSITELSCHDNMDQIKTYRQQSLPLPQTTGTETRSIVDFLAALWGGFIKVLSFFCCCTSCCSDDSDDECYPPSPTQDITQNRQLLTDIPTSSNTILQPKSEPKP